MKESGETEGVMSAAWEPESGPEHWGDTETWRGEEHPDSDESWRGETSPVEHDEQPQEEEQSAEPDSEDDWRGRTHLADWPEHMAGPEYWLFKRDGL